MRATTPKFTHGDWVQVYIDPDDSGSGPGFVRIEERHGAPGVVVLALWQQHVGMVHVFRRAMGKMFLELPRGFGGEGSGPRSDAVRELWEETGIRVEERDLIDLGAVYPNSGISSSAVSMFAVEVQVDVRDEIPDSVEVGHFSWVAANVVRDLIVRDVIRDSFTHAAVLRGVMHGLVRL